MDTQEMSQENYAQVRFWVAQRFNAAIMPSISRTLVPEVRSSVPCEVVPLGNTAASSSDPVGQRSRLGGVFAFRRYRSRIHNFVV